MQALQTHSIHFGEECLTKKIALATECCENPHVVENEGYLVCFNCGTVLSRVYDNSPRRAFTMDEISRRKTVEPVYSPIGPRTVIRGNTDSKGSLISAQDQLKFTRLGKIHRSLTSSYERNLWIALPNFQRLAERLSLPETVVKDAIRIYQEAVKLKLTMGRGIDILLAGAIFVALKIHGIPRMVEEIVRVCDLNKKNVVKCYRLLLLQIIPKLKIRITHLDSFRYVDSFGEELLLPMNVRQSATKLIRKAKNNGLIVEGKDPKGIAAAAIYLSAAYFQFPKTQNEIAKMSHITEVTLRMRCRELKKFATASRLPTISHPLALH